jgi:hypothetical protein
VFRKGNAMAKTKVNEFDIDEIGKYQGNLSTPYIKEPKSRFIKDVLNEYNRKEIILQPEFQRQFVWTKTKQKELIKSLYAGFPLPMFYFAESGNNNYEVVDGQQRLTTIFGFLNPKSINKRIRNKLISKIWINHNEDRISINNLRQIIKNRNIHCVYLPETSVNLKYEIFQVLNQNTTILKPQEIRNCLFANEMPKFNKLLKAVASKLRKITGMTLDRMLGEELVLRFFVINKYGYERDVTDLLNNFNLLKRDFNDHEIKRMKQKSEYFFRTLKKIFDSDIDDCFQVLQKEVKPPKINKWSFYSFSKKINQSLFHLLSFYLPKFSTHQLNSKNFTKIRKGYLELLKNKRFVSVITGSGTNSTRNIKKANQIFKKVFLEKYVGDWTVKAKRNITISEKETIRQNVPYCYLCYGKIGNNLPIGKIHAEHIEAYATGKESKLSNVLLAHPKCNAEKKDMSIDEYRETPKSQKRRKAQKKNIMAYCQALKEWNKAYTLDIYSRLMKFAKSDMSL